MATIVAVLFTWMVGGLSGLSMSTQSTIWTMLWGGLGFFSIGFADDLIELSPFLRLVVQGAIACLVWTQNIRIESIALPGVEAISLGWLSLPITVVWLVGVVNAVNWIDGLDGLAAGIGGIATAIIVVVCLQTGQIGAGLIGMGLLGSLAGFLVFNFNPAQIFMGDGGSYFVGFLLAAISINSSAADSQTTMILLPLLILAVPIMDMAFVILARVHQGKSPFIADDQHLHHRLLKAGLTHRFTVLAIYTLTCWIGSLALVYIDVPGSIWIVGSSTGTLTLMSCRVWLVAQRQTVSS
ncbi:MAG: MraY family glycosyltransferase [Phormidesmis sp.]